METPTAWDEVVAHAAAGPSTLLSVRKLQSLVWNKRGFYLRSPTNFLEKLGTTFAVRTASMP